MKGLKYNFLFLFDYGMKCGWFMAEFVRFTNICLCVIKNINRCGPLEIKVSKSNQDISFMHADNTGFETSNSKCNYGKAVYTVQRCHKLIMMHFFPLSDRSADIKKYTEQIQS